MIWTVPRMWEDGECWILGGGPSLPRQFGVPEETIAKVRETKELSLSAYSPYMSTLHDRHVIAVNSTFLIGPWIDMVFFGDKRWFFNNRTALAEFPGLKVTCHPFFKGSRYDSELIKLVTRNGNRPTGISKKATTVSWNLNSGAAAISVAVHTGVRRIILVGFDMTMDAQGFQHCHGEYKTAGKKRDPKKLPFNRHLRGFDDIAKDAKRMKVQIINASPDSAITVFKKITVNDLLNE